MQQRCIAAPFRGNALRVQQQRRLPSQPGSKLRPSALPGAFRTHNLSSSKPARGNLARAEPPGSGSFQGSVLALLQALDSKVEAARVALDKARDAYLADPDNQRLWEMYQDANHGLQKLMDTYQDLQAKSSGVAGTTGATELAERIASGGGTSTSGSSKDNFVRNAADLVAKPGLKHSYELSSAYPWHFWVDYNGRLQVEVNSWLELLVKKPNTTPALINGFPKLGKTLLMDHVLPALLKKHAKFQDSLMFRINCLSSGHNSMVEFLQDFYLQLSTWCSRALGHQLPPASGATASLLRAHIKAATREIEALARKQQKHVFFLIDECQVFLQPEDTSQILDAKVQGSSTSFFKYWTCDKEATNVHFVLTGSTMATVMAVMALARPNGFLFLTSVRTITLDSVASDEAMAETWKQLKTTAPNLPEELFKLSAPHPAQLAYLCDEFRRFALPSDDVEEFVVDFERDKLFAEVYNDWRPLLQVLPKDQAQALRALFTVGLTELQYRQIPSGFRRFLAHYKATENGRVVVKAPLFADIVSILLQEDGSVVEPTGPLRFPVALYNTWARDLKGFGDKVKFDGKNRVKPLPEAFKEEMEAMAAQLVDGLNMATTARQQSKPLAAVFLAHIEGSACFQLIEQDPRLPNTNSARLAAFLKVKDKLEPWEVVAYLHNLIRNYLGHDLVKPALSIEVPMIDSYPWLTTLRGGNLAKLVQTQGEHGQGQGQGDIPTSQASSSSSSLSSSNR